MVLEFLNNTAPDKIEAAVARLVAEDATYISLNFDNPELKKILPWTGTQNGRKAYTSTFIGVANYWTIEDFKISDAFGAGENVSVFGSFAYRSKTRGKLFRSPLAIHAKVKDGKISMRLRRIPYAQVRRALYESRLSWRDHTNRGMARE